VAELLLMLLLLLLLLPPRTYYVPLLLRSALLLVLVLDLLQAKAQGVGAWRNFASSRIARWSAAGHRSRKHACCCLLLLLLLLPAAHPLSQDCRGRCM
jgi:hypothetical protein